MRTDDDLRQRIHNLLTETHEFRANLNDVLVRSRRSRRRQRTAAAATLVTIALALLVPLSLLFGLRRSPVPSPGSRSHLTPGAGERVGASPSGYAPPQFEQPPGWYVLTTGFTPVGSTNPPHPQVANVPFDPADEPFGRADNTLVSMPPDGIVIEAWLVYPDETPATPGPVFPSRDLPLNLADAEVATSWETQPASNVPQYTITGVVNAQYLQVEVYFGTLTPSADQLQQTQQELNTLTIPPG